MVFSKPEFAANDNEAAYTKQQEYIELNGGVVSFNSDVFAISAVGKEPVVRVDALVDDVLVASAYIKILIVDHVVAPTPADPVTVELMPKAGDNAWNYSELKAAHTHTAWLEWNKASTDLYDKVDVKAAEFWTLYGGANDNYSYKVTVTNEKTKQPVEFKGTGAAGTLQNVTDGLWINVNKTTDGTENSSADVFINNEILTNITYVGGKYAVEITIEEDADVNVHGDVILTYEFTVTEDCKEYNKNATTWSDYHNSRVLVGRLVGGLYYFDGELADHFEYKSGKSVFEYMAANVTAVEMTMHWNGYTGNDYAYLLTDPTTAATQIKAVDVLTKPYSKDTIWYTNHFVNGEVHTRDYIVTVVNPLKAADASEVVAQVKGNATRATVNVWPEVEVWSNPANPNKENSVKILYYNEETGAAVWTEDAKSDDYAFVGTYKGVTYEIDTTTADYKTLVAQHDYTEFDVDAKGVFTFVTDGNGLAQDYNLNVIATVTFDLNGTKSIIKVNVPVVLKGNL